MRAVFTGLVLVGLMSGCASVSVEAVHASFPTKGYPFGPENEETTLDSVGIGARHEQGRMFMEGHLGYMYHDGGMRGNDLIFVGRVGYKIWQK